MSDKGVNNSLAKGDEGEVKKLLIIMVAIFVSLAFVTGAMAEDKKAAVKTKKVTGTVAAYEAGKSITVKSGKDKVTAFDIAEDAKVKGDILEGVKVSVSYKKVGDKNVATAISAVAEKAKTKGKK